MVRAVSLGAGRRPNGVPSALPAGSHPQEGARAARRGRTPRVSSAPVVMAVTFRDRGPFPVMAWRRCHKVPFSPIGLALGGGQGGAMGAATTRRFVLAAAV